jgi:Fanconi anemia group M protein
MAENLKEILTNHYNSQIKVEKFIGQTTKQDDAGFTQNRQSEIITDFREGNINVLLATSVAEEGLDIPNVDAIVFYEPVPSEIRMIQRRGRTGRHGPGRCYILITKGTIDVPFYRVANRKESTMNAILSQPKQLDLCTSINRRRINFQPKINKILDEESISTFYERKYKELQLVANRSIEEILDEIDKFSNSPQYKQFKKQGVTFVSDLINLDQHSLKKSILKIKGKKKVIYNKKRGYLNKNVKTLINIAKFFNKEGKISLYDFQKYASEEDIIDSKFFIHFNRACNLGYLKKEKDNVIFLTDYD